MNQPILVTGGSGTLGRAVVARLLDGGHEVRVLSRRPRPAGARIAAGWVTGELRSSQGLAAAVADVGAIVHCATNPVRPRVDRDGTANLLRAARAAGIPHLVYISIVGVDRIPYRYFQAKLEAERLIQTSGLPRTILRATQFHQLVLLVISGLARLPLITVPAASFQPIDAAEVADRLAELAVRTTGRADAGHGRPPDPQRHQPAARLPAGDRTAAAGAASPPARRDLRRLPARRPPGPDRAVGRRTWEQFLVEQVDRRTPIGAYGTTAEGRT